MHHYQYTLQAYGGPATRHRCPACGKPNVFSLYVLTGTKEYVHDTVGRCSREIKCGYHYTPRQFFAAQGNTAVVGASAAADTRDTVAHKQHGRGQAPPLQQPATATPVSFIPVAQVQASLGAYTANAFVSYLETILGEQAASSLVEQYLVGSSAHWPGAVVFWQIDTAGKIRTGKIMLYNATTGKRVKKPFNHISWVHKLQGPADFALRQCFFGEHLLNTNTKPVAIVESEKTALIASAYLPQYVWLASGSLSNLSAAKCEVLRNREVVLFPDINAYAKWKEKAVELKGAKTVSVSDVLENMATPEARQQGWDIADYLLQFKLADFVLHEPVAVVSAAADAGARDTRPNTGHPLLSKHPTLRRLVGDHPFIEIVPYQPKPAPVPEPNDWEKDLALLKQYYAHTTLPATPIRISPFETIGDVPKFVDAHLCIVAFNQGKEKFKPYLQRLQKLKEVLEKGVGK